jgi:hypothetical protein
MSHQTVHVRELAAWDLDPYEYRPHTLDTSKIPTASTLVAARSPYQQTNALLPNDPVALAAQATREDLQAEMLGLDWTLGIIDLRQLLAFQRRLSCNPHLPAIVAPQQHDTAALIALSFGDPRPTTCDLTRTAAGIFTLHTTDPNLHLRPSGNSASPLIVHGGSPFFEVALYRKRWFLRDGYHRAFALLSAGVFQVPAVIVHTRTLAELGATQPWFFSEETLLGDHPPRVTDFLDDALVLTYDRPALTKTVRVTIEESFAPAASGEHP